MLNNTTTAPVPIHVCKKAQKIQIGEHECLLSGAEIVLLTLLVDAQGEALSKDHLLSKGWEGRVVSQSSLPVAIKHIRDAFKKAGHSSVLHTAKNGGGYFIPRGGFSVHFDNAHPIKPDNLSINSAAEQCKMERLSVVQFSLFRKHMVKIIVGISLITLLTVVTNDSLQIYRSGNIISDTPIECLSPDIKKQYLGEHGRKYLFIGNGQGLVCEPDGECNYLESIGGTQCQ